MEGKILGDDGLPVSADITDERLVVYFRDDEGFVEKPKALKTRAELKAEARETRKLEKERKKQDAAFVKSLPRSERKEARKQLTLEARALIAETKLSQNEERLQNEARIKAALEEAQRKKDALAGVEPAVTPKQPRRSRAKKGEKSDE